MFSPRCPRPSAASGLRLSGAASPPFLACNWTPGRLRPPSREKTRRRLAWCLYKAGRHLPAARLLRRPLKS